MKVEFVVTEWGSNHEKVRKDTYEEAEQWIKDACRPDLMGTVEFQIHKVYNNKT